MLSLMIRKTGSENWEAGPRTPRRGNSQVQPSPSVSYSTTGRHGGGGRRNSHPQHPAYRSGLEAPGTPTQDSGSLASPLGHTEVKSPGLTAGLVEASLVLSTRTVQGH